MGMIGQTSDASFLCAYRGSGKPRKSHSGTISAKSTKGVLSPYTPAFALA